MACPVSLEFKNSLFFVCELNHIRVESSLCQDKKTSLKDVCLTKKKGEYFLFSYGLKICYGFVFTITR